VVNNNLNLNVSIADLAKLASGGNAEQPVVDEKALASGEMIDG